MKRALRKYAGEFVNVVLHDLEKNRVFIPANKLLNSLYIILVDINGVLHLIDFGERQYNSTKGRRPCLGNREDLRTC